MAFRKPIAILIMAFFAIGTRAWAQQEAPKADIFAGYSLFHADDNGLEDAIGARAPLCCSFTKILHGWGASVQYNFSHVFGIVADFSGNYGTPLEITGGNSVDSHMYNVLFGPQVNMRSSRFAAFARTMFGFQRMKIEAIPAPVNSPTFTNNSFAWAVGGGFDVNATHNVGIRLGQLDYIRTSQDYGLIKNGGRQNNFRYSAGIVFRVGSH
jgi:opacity protein-like surface antigen